MNVRALQRLIVWLAYLASFAPLVLLRNFYFPYIVPKTVFFRSVVGLMALLWIGLMARDARYRPRRNSWVTWALGIFVGVVLVAGFAGLDPRMSFWGDFERMWGFLTLAHFLAFFVVLSTTLEAKDWLRFFQVNLAVGTLVSVYGISQKLGLRIVEQAGVDRVIATLGNASYVGGYMLLVMAIALYLFAIRPRRERFWYLGAGSLALLAFFFSVTRGAYLGGIVAGAVVLAGLALKGASPGPRRLAVFSLGGALGLGLLIILLRNTASVKSSFYLTRLTDFSFQSNTTQTRFIGWSAGLRGFWERPLLGWGEENYIVVFNKYFPARFHTLAPTETYFDRAHNQFIDTLVSEGILGFVSYVAVYAFAGASVIGLWRRGAVDRATLLFFIGSITGYFVQNFFVFDTLAPFMVFLGIVAFGESLVRNAKLQTQNVAPRGAAVVPAQWLVPLVAVWLLTFWFFNIRVARASNLGAWAVGLQEPAVALPFFEQAVAYDLPAVRDVRNTFADFVVSRAEGGRVSSGGIKNVLDTALLEVDKTLAETPFDVLSATKAVKLLNLRFALFGERGDLARAEEIFHTILPRSPERLEIHFLGAQSAVLRGDSDEALRRLERARSLNPRYPDGYWFTGMIMLEARQATTSAVGRLKEAVRLGFSARPSQLTRAIAAAIEVHDREFLRTLYEMYLRSEPQNAEVWASLAATYRELGEVDNARAAAQRAAELDPKFVEEARRFIERLPLPER